MEIKELSAIEAAYSYDLEHISQLRTKSFKQGFIGQPRAMKALSMGMAVNTKGYNIYISGEDGTGRHRAVKEIASSMEALIFYDIAYGCNFSKRQAPFLLLLKSPQGRALEKLCNTISALVEEEQYNKALDIAETIEKNIEGTQAYIRQVKTALLRKEKNGELFRINLVVDNSVSTKLPLVNEYHPTSQNLFGQRAGASSALHMNLSCGSLLEAIGGFFIVQIDKVLSQKGLWSSLKVFAESSSFILGQEDGEGKTIVRPVVPELPIKIILVGSDSLYDKLCEEDENFLRLFKVSAEFDFSMDATDENIQGTIAYIEDFIKENSLFNVETEAICQILTYSSWYAEMRGELTTKLSFLGDLLFEANYIAKKEGLFSINASHIKKAMEERDFVNGLTEERINREIKTGEMIISLEGSKVGVVNGLAVMDRGLASFGTPTVISVSVAPGSEGIVNIEHEAGLSGEIHDKGLLILEGYLRKQYARTFPLSIYAGICFEQSYGEVDGDSASSSELFALLSAIGEIPVRQDIAVTGSVNQMGDIQPVGGINEKITGFFEICRIMGLTGRQGVIIPIQNVRSLILPEPIVKAIEEKKFHIYPISSIDEGMEILTLRPSGKRNVKGLFPPESVNRLIENRLKKLYDLSKSGS